ncbi:hypothetical protein [Vibrio sp. SCSIO 43136]|uniref:hypothetical protein n=1 Tax=Vibrio sp. SCSIO 43136 TaxID=2819101 RepID=UPI0020756E12|nr:hypothetical protein [Vibrio sp. SCSIO 43136]USD64585.1 hypothetical protein J4N39_10780 [Vibrio sp. SCSIO 43136]
MKVLVISILVAFASFTTVSHAYQGNAGKAFGAGINCELNGKIEQLPRELCLMYNGKIIL